MAGAEVTKLVLPSSIRFGNAVQGGKKKITGEDVSAALGYGKLSEPASAYVRLKYCLDGTYRGRLESWVTKEKVYNYAEQENWICGVSLLPKLTQVALDEALSDGVCKGRRGCGGTGVQVANGKLIPCRKCDGTGRKKHSKSHRARELGMHRHTFNRTWQQRYERIFGLFVEYEHELVQALRKKL